MIYRLADDFKVTNGGINCFSVCSHLTFPGKKAAMLDMIWQ